MIDPTREAENLLIDCDRCIRYHQARGDFLNKCHKWMMVAVIFSSTSAVAALSQNYELLATFIVLLPGLFGAIEIVWGLTDLVRRHESLVRRFHEVVSEININDATLESYLNWDSKVKIVYSEEPLSVYHALNAVCGNAAYQAAGRDRDKFQTYNSWQYHLRNWVKFNGNDFPRMDQISTPT